MGSLVEQVRVARERALSQPKTLQLAAPGYDNDLLVIEYGPIDDWERFEDIRHRSMSGDPQTELESNIDLLIDACRRFLVRDGDDDPVSLADQLRAEGEQLDGEVTFSHHASEVFELNTQSARETVLAVFAGAVSPELAVEQHAVRIASWMKGVSREVDARLGEGLPPTDESS